MKLFRPGELLKRKGKEPLAVSRCIEPWDDHIGVTSIDVWDCHDDLWLVISAFQDTPIGLPYYYVIGSSGFHGWTSARYMLERVK